MNDRFANAWALLPGYLSQHVVLSAAAMGLGLVVSLALVVAAVRSERVRWPVLAFASLIQTVPSLALLALFYPFLLVVSGLAASVFGTGFSALGFLPSLLALALYSMLPVIRNGVAGILNIDAAVIERVLLHGDLRQLSAQQKLSYYQQVCTSLGLNPLTQPFAYIVLNGKETLYAKREATDQLRFIHGISIEIKSRDYIEGSYVVTACATMPNGRKDESTGAVTIDTLKGDARANALMKAETKAKRRVTLSICGLGMLDETEVTTIPGAQPVPVDPAMGEWNGSEAPAVPEGYDEWLLDMEAQADSGMVALTRAWREAKPAYRTAMPQDTRQALKQRAAAVDAQRANQVRP